MGDEELAEYVKNLLSVLMCVEGGEEYNAMILTKCIRQIYDAGIEDGAKLVAGVSDDRLG